MEGDALHRQLRQKVKDHLSLHRDKEEQSTRSYVTDLQRKRHENTSYIKMLKDKVRKRSGGKQTRHRVEVTDVLGFFVVLSPADLDFHHRIRSPKT